MDSTISKCKALIILWAILSKFSQCDTKDNIEIHLNKQHGMSRLASRLQNYMKQQDGFKRELVRTYGWVETATLIKEYIQIKRNTDGDVCIADVHDFPVFL